MKSLDNEEKLMMFSSVENMLLRKNIPVNENAMTPIQQTGDYLDYIAKGTSSLIEKDKPYVIVKNLGKILEFIGYSFEGKDISEQEDEIKKAMKELKKYVTRFRELEDNPRRFFSDESRIKEAYKISSKMKNFYQRLVDEEYLHELTTPEY